MRRVLPILLLLGAAPLAAAPPLIADAWIRATPPGAPNAAAYLTIEADVPDRLVAARSEAAREVQIHAHEHADGMMRMRRLESLPVPAGVPVLLEPGGRHLMLREIGRPLAAGDEVVITLSFERAGDIEAVVVVRDTRRGAAP